MAISDIQGFPWDLKRFNLNPAADKISEIIPADAAAVCGDSSRV
jgi:hypothetical protein